MTIAALGFLAFFLDIFGLIVAVRDGKSRAREDGVPLLSKIAIGLNIVGIVGLIAVYVIGIVV